MRAGLENFRRRGLAALLLTGVLLVAGATSAAAGGYGSDGSDCHDCPTPPPTTAPHSPPVTEPPHTPPTTVPPHTPPPATPHYGSSYPVPPSNPPGNPPEPGEPQRNNPPLLPRTGSNTGTLVGIGAGVLAAGGALVIVARKRRLATVPT